METSAGHTAEWGVTHLPPHHAPHMPNLSVGLPRAAASILASEQVGVWGHSKAVGDPVGSSKVRVEEGYPKAKGSKRQGRGTHVLGIKAAFYIPVYFRNNGVILFSCTGFMLL